MGHAISEVASEAAGRKCDLIIAYHPPIFSAIKRVTSHGSTSLIFDAIKRYLKYKGYTVTWVVNITDVDDKIIAKAKESGEPIDSITKRTTQAYHDDMAALNALPPDIEPRATQHIAQMIAMAVNAGLLRSVRNANPRPPRARPRAPAR